MAMFQQGFILDVKGFQNKIAPILRMVEEGNPRPLFFEALEVAHHTNSDDWILDDVGSSLFDIQTVGFMGSPYDSPIEMQLENPGSLDPALLGYWFLIILSEFLQETTGIGTDYGILQFCLEEIGWKQKDIDQLINGSPMSILLNPRAIHQPKMLSFSDPYWFWMRPSHSSGGGGWQNKEQIHFLFELLERSKPQIDHFDPAKFGKTMGNFLIAVPDRQLDCLQRAKEAVNSALEMLNQAMVADRELYMLIAYT
jgi:hypothetical protein